MFFLLWLQELDQRGFKERTSPLKRYTRIEAATKGINSNEATQELAADQFAAALLMPQAMFRRAYEKLASL